jgi:hypothetical protein
VVGLGAAFFAASEALEVCENVGTVSDHSSSPARRLLLVLPVAAMNTVFVYWIFISLSKTLNKLKVSKKRGISGCFLDISSVEHNQNSAL